MSIEAGGAFTCKDDSFTGDDQHLWIIVSDPRLFPDCVVIVNLSSSTNKTYDPACALKAGDHPFITHATFVYYRRAQVVTLQQLSDAVISHKASVNAGVLARIREGANKTHMLPRKIKQHLIDQGIIPFEEKPATSEVAEIPMPPETSKS